MLPVWVYSGKQVLYIYMDGNERMMEVYDMEGDASIFKGVQPCDMDIRGMQELSGPWREEMNKRRRYRIQGIKKLGQPSLF